MPSGLGGSRRFAWSSNPKYQNAARAAPFKEEKKRTKSDRLLNGGLLSRLCCTRVSLWLAEEEREALLEDFSPSEVDLLIELGVRPQVGSNFSYQSRQMAQCRVLHGRDAQDPDHEEWMRRSSAAIADSQYVALSYKHMHWVDEERDENQHRHPKMSVAEASEVQGTMIDQHYTKYWHDGAKPRWNRDNVSCARGLYPYLLDGGKVLVVPPMCREQVPDPTTWVSAEYPRAQDAFAECVRYVFNEQPGLGVRLVRRNVPGVPSVAWGSMMRVWLLAESFCGCLHGRIQFTTKGKERMREFIREIRTVLLMVDFFLEKGIERLLVTGSSESVKWETNLNTRLEQKFELIMLLKDVLNYYDMVTNPNADRNALALSTYFLERMAFAGATNHSDRVVVGSMCAMMLQQVFGHGLAVDTAIREYERAEDPLAFAVMVASAGNNAIPLSATTQQIRASLLALQQRTSGSHYNVSDAGALLSQWPQPMPGRCYAGTLTSSPWKSIFWHALSHNRGLGLEHDLEKAMSHTVVNSSKYREQRQSALAARKKHFKRRHLFQFSTSRLGKTVDNDSLMWDPTHPKHKIYRPLDEDEKLLNQISPETQKKRDKGLRQIVDAWNKSQAALIPVIGDKLPLLVDDEEDIVALYVADVRGIDGLKRKQMEMSPHPLVCSSIKLKSETATLFDGPMECEWLTTGGEKNTCFIKPTETSKMPVITLVVSNEFSTAGSGPLDAEVEMNILEHPLLQIVLNIPCKGEKGYLLAMRRVWNPFLAGGMPADPRDLRTQKRMMRWGDSNALLESGGLDDDCIFPTRVVREQLADYTQMSPFFEAWHAPGIISHYHDTGGSVEIAPERWNQRWAQVEQALATNWEQELGPWEETASLLDANNPPAEFIATFEADDHGKNAKLEQGATKGNPAVLGGAEEGSSTEQSHTEGTWEGDESFPSAEVVSAWQVESDPPATEDLSAPAPTSPMVLDLTEEPEAPHPASKKPKGTKKKKKHSASSVPASPNSANQGWKDDVVHVVESPKESRSKRKRGHHKKGAGTATV